MKCPRCQQENPSRARVCTACGARLAVRAKRQGAKAKARLPVSRKAPKNEEPRVRDLEKRLAEALEREADALKRRSSSRPRRARSSTSSVGLRRTYNRSSTPSRKALSACAKATSVT